MKGTKKLFIIFLILSALIASTVMVFALESSDEYLEVEFIPLGIHGDSFVARIGDQQLLVDAGGKTKRGVSKKQIEIITPVIERFMADDNDKVWEYVIATHADLDHIDVFATSIIEKDDKGIFKFIKDKGWSIGTLIDFDITEDDTVAGEEYDKLKNGKNTFFNSGKYMNYAHRRDDFIKEGIIQSYFTASQCCFKQRSIPCPKEGATDLFKFGNANIRILYNYYYDHRVYPDRSDTTSTEKNCLSVCFMIEHGSQKMLFTGDLEEYDSTNGFKQIGGEDNGLGGETLLYKYNKEYLDGGVDLYKAAHHGSKSSNSEEFIKNIKDSVVLMK
jgi:hypothetical protein